MVALFSVAVTLMAIVAAIFLLRRHGYHCFGAWFLAGSVAFINVAFTVNAIATPFGNEGAADGALVTSIGLLTATLATLLAHSGVGFLIASRRRMPVVTAFEVPTRKWSDNSLLLIAVCILGPAWLYFVLLGSVPLFDALRALRMEGVGGLGELQAARLARDPYATSTASRVPMQGLLEVFRNFGSPLVFAYALAQYRLGAKGRLRPLVMALAILTSLAAGQRWPLMRVLIAAIMTLSLTSATVPRKRIMQLVVVGAGAGAILSALQARTTESLLSAGRAILFGIGNLAERIFLLQAQIPIASYSLEPNPFRNMGGATYIQSLATYLPGPGESFPVDFYRGVTGDPRGHTAPPDFYTEAYINFGLLGVVVLSATWVIAITAVDMRPAPRSPETVAMTVGAGCFLAMSASSGIVFTLASAVPLSVAYAIFRRGGRELSPTAVVPETPRLQRVAHRGSASQRENR